MTLVRRDQHGLYVKTGGYIFRPQVSWWLRQGVRDDTRTTLTGGEKVKARHIGGTILARVDGQIWYSHDSYFADRADERGIVPEIPSDLCWSPVSAPMCAASITNVHSGATFRCSLPVQFGEQRCRIHLAPSCPNCGEVSPRYWQWPQCTSCGQTLPILQEQP